MTKDLSMDKFDHILDEGALQHIIQPARKGCYWQTVPPQWGGGRLFDGSTKFFLWKLL